MIGRMTFIARDYRDTRDWLAPVFPPGSSGRYLIEILDDAIASGLPDVVSLTTSMHDLVLSPSPTGDAYEAVVVRAPGSLHHPQPGNVRVDIVRAEQTTSTTVERPMTEAVPVFWAAMRDAFGVSRHRPDGTS
jgi:hypothetical protein